jgi:hypothetical protein
MASRRRPNRLVEKDVMVSSRRRCCLCVFLNNRNDVRKGQIAHLNRDPNDSRFENLVYLCLEHHDEYDSQTSQSKALLLEEVRDYRNRLYAENKESKIVAQYAAASVSAELAPLPDISQYEVTRRKFPSELQFTSKPWTFSLWQTADEPELFAYKTSHGADGVCLIERIDLPDGRIVIICIAIAGNPGTSITNCVESLCFQVCERFEIPAERLVWIEHYDYYDPTEWNLVTFAARPPNALFSDPTWTPMDKEMWRSLCLRPKRKLTSSYGSYGSKITKLFPWPPDE